MYQISQGGKGELKGWEELKQTGTWVLDKK